jgi:drug/metabolite transporter (DMT)-like permease
LSKPARFTILGLSVLMVSSAAIMIRFAQAEAVSSVAIAAWRLGIAALVLVVVVAVKSSARDELRKTCKKDYLLAIISGLFLAAHFASWISSLRYTSVASSTALVTTNPIWIALVSWLIFREKLGRWLIIGIVAAIVGSGLIFASDARLMTGAGGENPPLGNMLALIGSLTVCGYLLIGRRLRTTMTLLPYIVITYSSAAVALLLAALAAGHPLAGYSALAWACLVGLGLGPQLLGHSGINWALKHIPATFIAIVILGEPIGSSLLAWWIFGETFAPLQLAGFTVLLAGIYFASRDSGG